MSSRRILITGLSTYLGGRLAQALEREDQVQTIVGVDTSDPRHQLERTEFVRVDIKPELILRIVNAAAIDTVIDTRLIADSIVAAPGRTHEVNVTGTAGILAACNDLHSPVRKVVFKSSAHYYGCEPSDPEFFTEEMTRTKPPKTTLEREIVAAEGAIKEFASQNPGVCVTTLRFADPIGSDLRASHLALLSLPVVPAIIGFDPRFQFIHEDDVVGVLAHAARHDLPGTYNAAADGVLVLSEVVSLLGKPLLPVLPPWGAPFAAAQLRRFGLRTPVELLKQLRYGRGLDNRRLKATGYTYRYTTREAVLKLRAHQRLRPLLGSGSESYRYEREVEEFLRWSPSVRSAGRGSTGEPDLTEAARQPADGAAVPAYDQLSGDELIEIISSLEPEALFGLQRYEASHKAREAVLDALDRNIKRKRPSTRRE